MVPLAKLVYNYYYFICLALLVIERLHQEMTTAPPNLYYFFAIQCSKCQIELQYNRVIGTPLMSVCVCVCVCKCVYMCASV